MPSIVQHAAPIARKKRKAIAGPSYMQLRRRALTLRLSYGEVAFLAYTLYTADARPALAAGRGRRLRMQPAGLWSFVAYMSGYSQTRDDVGVYLALALDAAEKPRAPAHLQLVSQPSETIITIS